VLGRRGALVVGFGLAGAWAWTQLGLELDDLVPSTGGRAVAWAFFEGALSPALDYEAAVAAGAPPFCTRLLEALGHTLLYAAAALALALPFGLTLGLVASSTWWEADPLDGPRTGWRIAVASLRGAVRGFIALVRSVHELLWAVILLAAMGISSATGVIALALPLIGTLAKVFSELVDEADGDGARGLVAAGASPTRVFLWGRLPAALPDMAAYAYYRFECALRTSAVLGFFGFPTVGHHLRLAFEENHYREVWSYLYGLILVIVVLERWGAALRRRFVA